MRNHPPHVPRHPSQILPEDISCVLTSSRSNGSLFISNLEAAENPHTLNRYQINAIITSCKGVRLNHPLLHLLYIGAEDHPKFNLMPYFDQAADFIHQHLQHTNVLVHCMAGVSRSASLVLAYFIKYHHMSFTGAFEYLRGKRQIINPNRGFVAQLQEYAKETTMRPNTTANTTFNTTFNTTSNTSFNTTGNNHHPNTTFQKKQPRKERYTHDIQEKYSKYETSGQMHSRQPDLRHSTTYYNTELFSKAHSKSSLYPLQDNILKLKNINQPYLEYGVQHRAKRTQKQREIDKKIAKTLFENSLIDKRKGETSTHYDRPTHYDKPTHKDRTTNYDKPTHYDRTIHRPVDILMHQDRQMVFDGPTELKMSAYATQKQVSQKRMTASYNGNSYNAASENYASLSRELDERIARIKQKYQAIVFPVFSKGRVAS